MADARPANAKQAQRWNGASGQYWIEHRERHLAEHQHLVPHLFRTAGISPGERVLDVGCGCGTTTIEAARAARGTTQAPPPRRDPGGIAVGLDLTTRINDPAATERVLAGVAGEYAARQSADGVWVRAAAWLVTARRTGRRTRCAAVLL